MRFAVSCNLKEAPLYCEWKALPALLRSGRGNKQRRKHGDVLSLNYDEAIAYINGRAGMGKKVGLENMRRLLARLGDPQDEYPTLHVAGTNGKGSVCAFTMSALRAAGHRVGMYTSPYLMRYNERMQINGQPIPDETLAALTERVAKEIEQMEALGEGIPTIFETGTAIAFLYFAQEKVDFAVIEVGLGGRFDPTNVIHPAACAIARIGLDHTRTLGSTIDKIAFEKAGIVKDHTPLALQAQDGEAGAVIRAVCAQRDAPCLDLNDYPPQAVRLHERGAGFYASVPGLEGDYAISLPGEHQVANAMTALGLLSLVKERAHLDQRTVREGLAAARWPGRLEWFGSVLLDGAHNPQGAASLAAYLRSLPETEKPVLLTGVMADKDVEQIVKVLAPCCRAAVCVRPEGISRAMDPERLCELFRGHGVQGMTAPNTREGLRLARQMADGAPTVVCGSLYLAGEARLCLQAEEEKRNTQEGA